MPFKFDKLDLDGVVQITPRIFYDERGYFLESFKASDFSQNGIDVEFLQDNHSLSQKGVLRGLHYQLPPKAQGKLVKVVSGVVWDVAVDIRKHSPNFKKWIAVELSGEKNNMLYIPPGFAHGFVAMTDNVNLLYKCTNEYSQINDSGIRWDDPEIGIDWPDNQMIISEKDRNLPLLKDTEVFE